MGWTDNQMAFNLLKRSYEKSRLSHAYLFVGDLGTGKVETALSFAKMLYCTSDDKPCNECPNCKRIDAMLHPNVIFIEANGQNIKKEQIQEIIQELSKTSLENGPRIYIINDADKMSLQAANSLLKFIEEPIDQETHAILITKNQSAILPTIISRCQIINFHAMNKEKMKKELSYLGIDKNLINILPEVTSNIDDAKKLIDTSLLDISLLVSEVGKMLLNNESLILFFDKNQSILFENKENINLFMHLFLIYFMDVLHYKIGDKNPVFEYSIKDIEALSKKSRKVIVSDIETITECKEKLRFNVNPIIQIKNMLTKIEMGRK